MPKSYVEIPMSGDSVRFTMADMALYDYTKHNLGPVFYQGTDIWTGSETFIGPVPISVARPMESNIATAAGFPHAVKISKTKFAIVLGDCSTAATTRKFLLYIYDIATNTMTYTGAIINATAFSTAATIRGLRLQRTVHTNGTVSVSGTTVTGNGTTWLSRRVNAGSRIGFGSTDPDQITTWYDITPGTAISSETSLTLVSSPGTIAAGTSYIIEDYSLIFGITCATATDGGLRIIKGLSLSTACWSPTATATAIATASSTDNVRAMYIIKDAATLTNTVIAGFGLDDVSSDNLTQNCYVLDGSSTTAKFYVYNVKKALTLSSGVDTTAYQYATGAQAVIGNVSQIHNCRIGTLKHGAGNGVKSLYFTTTTRLYRCALSGITTGSTTFLNDAMLEIPTGSVNTYPATAAMSNLEIFDSLDRIGWFSSGATAFRHYITRYRTDSSQLDYIWLGDTKAQHQAASDGNAYPYPSTDSTVMSSWGEGGMVFLSRHGTTAALNQIYVVPLGAQMGFQSDGAPYNVYITPAISTPNASSYTRVIVNSATLLGNAALGVTPEGFVIYYRTSGITDNTGTWLQVPIDGDLSGVAAASSIQFKFEFRIISITCVPGRIFNVGVAYTTSASIQPELRWNMDDSSSSDGTVGFYQTTLFSTLPTVLQIDYYRSDTNANVLSQQSGSTTNGVFEYWNGSSWTAGIGTNTVGLRRRFRPTSGLPNGIAVYTTLQTIS